MNEIKLIQAPIIKHELGVVGKSIDQRLEELNIEGQIATEETVQSLKKLRAELNSELKEYEEQRKTVKNALLEPYNAFDAEYKVQVSDKMNNAVNLLKDKIAEVENRIKSNKTEEIKEYFVELCLSEDIDFLSLNQVVSDVNMTITVKKYKEQVLEFVEKVKDELLLISTQEHKAEILVLYKKTLNAAKAIKEIQDRKQAEKIELDRIKMLQTQRRTQSLTALALVYHDLTRTYNWGQNNEVYISMQDIENLNEHEFQKKFIEIEEAVKPKTTPTIRQSQPLTAPEVVKPQVVEEIVIASFEVSGTMNQLRGLGDYMRVNNITYKNID